MIGPLVINLYCFHNKLINMSQVEQSNGYSLAQVAEIMSHYPVIDKSKVGEIMSRYPEIDKSNFSTDLFFRMVNAISKLNVFSINYVDTIMEKYKFLNIPNDQFVLLIVNIPKYLSCRLFFKQFDNFVNFCSTSQPSEERNIETLHLINLMAGTFGQDQVTTATTSTISTTSTNL